MNYKIIINLVRLVKSIIKVYLLKIINKIYEFLKKIINKIYEFLKKEKNKLIRNFFFVKNEIEKIEIKIFGYKFNLSLELIFFIAANTLNILEQFKLLPF